MNLDFTHYFRYEQNFAGEQNSKILLNHYSQRRNKFVDAIQHIVHEPRIVAEEVIPALVHLERRSLFISAKTQPPVLAPRSH